MLTKIPTPCPQNIDINSFAKEEAVKHLSNAFGGVTIVQKGSVDYISNGETGN